MRNSKERRETLLESTEISFLPGLCQHRARTHLVRATLAGPCPQQNHRPSLHGKAEFLLQALHSPHESQAPARVLAPAVWAAQSRGALGLACDTKLCAAPL